jgi:hypothetical protein
MEGAVFDKPTINDFLDLLRTETDRALDALAREATALGRAHSASGTYRSGGMIRSLLDASETTFRQRLDDALVALRRVTREGDIDARDLRDTTFQHLTQLTQLVRNASGVDRLVNVMDAGGIGEVVNQHFAQLDQNLRFQFRQFNIGWAGRQEDVSVTQQVVNNGTIVGTVQQGATGATVTGTISINIDTARNAASALAQELQAGPQAPPIIDMRADVDTIRAQLGKSEPSMSLLREAGRTLRNLSESVASGLLTPSAATALAALLAALGLS